MGLTDALGRILDPGGAADADAQGAGITQSLTPGSDYYNSGNLGIGTKGTTANGILNGAATVGAKDIGVDYSAMDNDAAQLGSAANIFNGYFQNGGLEEAAARNVAMARAGGAQGGAAGVQQLLGNVQANAGQVSQVGSQERGAMGQNANALTAQQLALQLKKQVFQAAVTHANVVKNMEAQALQNNLGTMQKQYALQLAQGATNASGAQQAIGLQDNKTTFNNAMTVGSALLGAGSQAGGTLAANFNTPAMTVAPAAAASGTGDSAGYQLSSPATSTGVNYSNPQSPVMADNTTQQSTQAPSQYSWLTTSLA